MIKAYLIKKKQCLIRGMRGEGMQPSSKEINKITKVLLKLFKLYQKSTVFPTSHSYV